MKGRCLNSKNYNYKNYGGRGITVCKRWMKFNNFLADMGERPDGMSIDRVDNNRGYSKDNCRWATRKEQCRNKRNSHLITFRNKTMILSEWAKEIGTTPTTLTERLRRGWNEEKTISAPIEKRFSNNK